MIASRPLLLAACATVAAAACGGRAAIEDPLAPVPVRVAADEVEPPPLRVQWKWSPERTVAGESAAEARERERALLRAELATRPPAVGDSVVVVASGDALRAHRAADGAVLWRARLAAPVIAGPVVVGEWVVAGTQSGDWFWLAAHDGAVRGVWHAAGSADDLVAAAGRVVVAFADRLIAVTLPADAAEPKVLWQRELAGGDAAGATTSATTERSEDTRRLAVGSDEAVVYLTWRRGAAAIALDSGRELWRRADLRLLPVRAAVGAGRLFLIGADSVPTALSARDGHRAWRGKRVGSLVAAAPAYADGVVWVAGLDAALHGYAAATGSHLFRVPLAARCYVDLTAYARWIVAGPSSGPWTLVRAPLRPASPSDPGQPRTLTVAADGDVEWPAAAGGAGVALTDTTASLRLLRPGASPYLPPPGAAR